MAFNLLIHILTIFLIPLLVFLKFWIKAGCKSSIPTDWPVFRMTPGVLKNTHRIHEFVTDVLKECHGTFQFKGPVLADLDLLVTSEPANIHHILSKNFTNYPKGPDFRKIFDILGDGIFNADAHLWELHRKTTTSLFNNAEFYKMLLESTTNKVKKGLIPVLDHASRDDIEVDLQEIFQRLTFDSICSLLLDYDPQSLSLELPYISCEKAFTATEEALLYRHVLPESILKLQSVTGFGKERGLSKAREAFDQFIYSCISTKRQQLQIKDSVKFSPPEGHKLDLLTAYMEAYKEKTGNPEIFLRDTLLNLMLAGRDTTSTALSWFFWLLAKNPAVERKILEEIDSQLHSKEEIWMLFRKREDLGKLVYLHGSLCEALRLFPPVALEHKAPMQPDILPSGHPVNKDSKIVLSFYSMGRMESIWGKDCLEFKPERWITDKGGIKHEPSYKFPAFNAGPRTCLGKEMAFIQMKMVATSILHNYKIEVVKGQQVVPSDSVILQMKYGLKVMVSKRSS
ncbi:alkane hydroxylase MAH1-like [Daucus carota subsp. sativus]|uniref:alkane hydroxylase MAH1-like n=1 Tax=Daucus carota subsp. sativus TaxID=79200 RepID=UPI0007EF4648|nr:PREDICTED: alkane hydroxylase MAH1-like [Daucus carota subsp. sativus]